MLYDGRQIRKLIYEAASVSLLRRMLLLNLSLSTRAPPLVGYSSLFPSLCFPKLSTPVKTDSLRFLSPLRFRFSTSLPQTFFLGLCTLSLSLSQFLHPLSRSSRTYFLDFSKSMRLFFFLSLSFSFYHTIEKIERATELCSPFFLESILHARFYSSSFLAIVVSKNI